MPIDKLIAAWLLIPLGVVMIGAGAVNFVGPGLAAFFALLEAAATHRSSIAVSGGRRSRKIFLVYRLELLGLLELPQRVRERIDQRGRNACLAEADIKSVFDHAAGQ